ncbi:MAG TPA: hypothetical protein PLG05_08150 [Bacteroidales bacterium]|jgi:hypothetical protein|nr:hypothetical protein [Bacteroidales bacterium]HPL05134.1 hypothetical protein [Bacteroidales bacterium]
MYTLVKRYIQNFDGIPVAEVTMKIHFFTLKLKAEVKMINGGGFILKSYPLEENHEFEGRLEIAIYNYYKNN